MLGVAMGRTVEGGYKVGLGEADLVSVANPSEDEWERTHSKQSCIVGGRPFGTRTHCWGLANVRAYDRPLLISATGQIWSTLQAWRVGSVTEEWARALL